MSGEHVRCWPAECECGANFDEGMGVIEVVGAIMVVGHANTTIPVIGSRYVGSTVVTFRSAPTHWADHGTCSECGATIHPVQSG